MTALPADAARSGGPAISLTMWHHPNRGCLLLAYPVTHGSAYTMTHGSVRAASLSCGLMTMSVSRTADTCLQEGQSSGSGCNCSMCAVFTAQQEAAQCVTVMCAHLLGVMLLLHQQQILRACCLTPLHVLHVTQPNRCHITSSVHLDVQWVCSGCAEGMRWYEMMPGHDGRL